MLWACTPIEQNLCRINRSNVRLAVIPLLHLFNCREAEFGLDLEVGHLRAQVWIYVGEFQVDCGQSYGSGIRVSADMLEYEEWGRKAYPSHTFSNSLCHSFKHTIFNSNLFVKQFSMRQSKLYLSFDFETMRVLYIAVKQIYFVLCGLFAKFFCLVYHSSSISWEVGVVKILEKSVWFTG